MQSSSLPTVSFIIPTLNAERFLPRCLAAIRGQDYPAEKIEIIVADAYSTDQTRTIAEAAGATVIDNPEILHEPGKTLATASATGEILFYTDADNIIVGQQWLKAMVKPYMEQPDVLGFLPQTTAPADSSSLNQYLGSLFTDPLTWFIYGPTANPHDYNQHYQPVVKTNDYQLYRFSVDDHPLFGLSQGVGVARQFQRGQGESTEGAADDILAGIKLIEQGGSVAYVAKAKLHHYHVTGFGNFMKKYRWRIRNNLQQTVKGMGLVNRLNYFSRQKKLRLYLFVPYACSIVFPLIDTVRLTAKWKSPVMLWHLPACLCLAGLIVIEYTRRLLGLNTAVGTYGK